VVDVRNVALNPDLLQMLHALLNNPESRQTQVQCEEAAAHDLVVAKGILDTKLTGSVISDSVEN
jgi:hypothetical protein